MNYIISKENLDSPFFRMSINHNIFQSHNQYMRLKMDMEGYTDNQKRTMDTKKLQYFHTSFELERNISYRKDFHYRCSIYKIYPY